MDCPRGHRRRRSSTVAIAALMAATTAAMLGLSAVLDWPDSEPAARRSLCLRAAELDGWMRQELLRPLDRFEMSEPGGVADGTAAWTALLAAVEGGAARSFAAGATLPSLREGELAAACADACGARRFTPFSDFADLQSERWPRQARLLAALVSRAPARDPGLPRWLDVAVVLGSDLRRTGLLAPALAASALEHAVAARLEDATALEDVGALRALRGHAARARETLPPPSFFAEREARLAQARLCAHAGIPPFSRALEAGEPEAAWPLVPAAAAVERLDGYAARLRDLLGDGEDARERYESWAGRFAAELPLAATLLADTGARAPLRDAADRLAAIVERASRRLDALPAEEPR